MTEDDVITLHRIYSKFQGCLTYRRRISWISTGPQNLLDKVKTVALYEYMGQYPGNFPHGNAKKSTRLYMMPLCCHERNWFGKQTNKAPECI